MSGRARGRCIPTSTRRAWRAFAPPGTARAVAPAFNIHANEGMGPVFVHVAVDDHSRYAYLEQHADERAPTCVAFLERALAHFAELGLAPAEAVMTDGARCYRTAVVFQEALARAGARHIVTPPYTPRWNGKAERFTPTMKAKWAFAHEWPSAARARASHRGFGPTIGAGSTARSGTGRRSAAFTTSVGRTARSPSRPP